MSKSRPVYRKLAFEPFGQRHLLVCDQAALPDDALENGFPLKDAEIWVVGTMPPGVAAPDAIEVPRFETMKALLTALRVRLAGEHMGLRLYAAGTEAFLWDVAAVAREAGLGEGEVFLNHCGSMRRRVYCVHCKTVTEDVIANLIPCHGCGATLVVRDHFSRRLAAFIGVQADAEVPGELPALEISFA
jgi:hypothetical protein